MCTLDEHSTWRDVICFAASRGDRDWVYIITGKGGPTGKTFLYEMLKKNHYNAVEISEDLMGLVEYRDDKNHYIVDRGKKQVVIVLNKPICRKGRYPWRGNCNPVEKAYDILVGWRDGTIPVSKELSENMDKIEELIGYLGEALED